MRLKFGRRFGKTSLFTPSTIKTLDLLFLIKHPNYPPIQEAILSLS